MATATRLRERPILFSGPMVQAILENRKTQTRRVIKPQPSNGVYITADGRGWADMTELQVHSRICRPMPYQVGMRLWVRETWKITAWGGNDDYVAIRYLADDSVSRPIENVQQYLRRPQGPSWKARPSIHLPRWASRITLEIIAVRVQRLQEISEEDSWGEGVMYVYGTRVKYIGSAKALFASTWNDLNARRGFGWDKNPWVWAITFRRLEK